jgi:ribonuclease HII
MRELDPVSLDETFRARGFERLAGVDEAGRGPLAGPVVAAAVILPSGLVLKGLRDSKALSPEQRERFFDLIHLKASAVGVGSAEAEEIDRINILQATLRAMRRAVTALHPPPHALLIDGRSGIGHLLPQFPLVKGDARSQSIAAASVIAKVHRDRIMLRYHESFPHYGFDRHKGYGTREHLEAVRRHGCSPIHRRSFRGVKETLG